MRTKLGKLCRETIKLLEVEMVQCEDVKSEISLSFPEYKNSLNGCTTIRSVFEDVIRPEVSLVEIDLLKLMYNAFKLSRAPLLEYSQEIESFSERMLEHSYGQELMDELHCHILKYNSIIFVLDWEGNSHTLKDLETLFQRIVKKKRRKMKVTVIYEGNSIVVECYVRCNDELPLIVEEINEKHYDELVSLNVIRILAAGKIIFERQESQDKVHVASVVQWVWSCTLHLHL